MLSNVHVHVRWTFFFVDSKKVALLANRQPSVRMLSLPNV